MSTKSDTQCLANQLAILARDAQCPRNEVTMALAVAAMLEFLALPVDDQQPKAVWMRFCEMVWDAKHGGRAIVYLERSKP